MIFGSVCAGIEAASVAWHPLGWRAAFVSEIEPFPRAVLQHQLGAAVRPDDASPDWAPNGPELLGDFTGIRGADWPQVELLAGGTPCQAFSISGKRAGLDDRRGNLSLAFVELVHDLVSNGSLRWAVWENVPGVLTMPDNAFGCFLGALVGADAPLRSPLERGRWPGAGMVGGPGGRAAWRVFDAQHFGLAQRRERVWLVFSAGEGDPAAVLFERKGGEGDYHPRREAREGPARDIAPSLTASGRGVERTGESRGQEPVVPVRLIPSHDPAVCLTAREYKSAMPEADLSTVVAHTLTAGGFDASEDGTGRGTPLVPVAFNARQDPDVWGDRCGPLDTDGASIAIAIGSKDHGADASVDISPTLRAGGHAGSHPNAGVPPAVAFALRGREGGALPEVTGDKAGALRAANGGSSRDYVATGWAVRRLTPRECERLQGFPDDWTLVPTWKTARPNWIEDCLETARWLMAGASGFGWRDALALSRHPDGPRYKACGNSWPVFTARWIGARIDAEDKRVRGRAAPAAGEGVAA